MMWTSLSARSRAQFTNVISVRNCCSLQFGPDWQSRKTAGLLALPLVKPCGSCADTGTPKSTPSSAHAVMMVRRKTSLSSRLCVRCGGQPDNVRRSAHTRPTERLTHPIRGSDGQPRGTHEVEARQLPVTHDSGHDPLVRHRE